MPAADDTYAEHELEPEPEPELSQEPPDRDTWAVFEDLDDDLLLGDDSSSSPRPQPPVPPQQPEGPRQPDFPDVPPPPPGFSDHDGGEGPRRYRAKRRFRR